MNPYRFYLLPDPKEKKLYIKNTGCDITLNPLEAKIFKTKNLRDISNSIRSNLIQAFDVDIPYSFLPVWKGMNAKNIPIECEFIPGDQFKVMRTGKWREILAKN